MRYSGTGFAVALMGVVLLSGCAAPPKTPVSPAIAKEKKMDAKGPLDFTVKDIDGKDVALSTYKGKVVMIVNVASQCGLTPQYEKLQALYTKYSEKGFVILGFPANEFGGQEPGSDSEIKQFCTSKYSVTFPMFSKVVVKGEGIHPLFQLLTDKDTLPEFGGEIQWNFNKFLIGRNGQVIERFGPMTDPEAGEVTAAIEKALSAGA